MKLWYLLAYDVRDPKRLRRLHYRLSKRALAVQESVFLVQADPHGLRKIIDLVNSCTHTRKDDVRLYPVTHPNALWNAGIQAQVFSGLQTPGGSTRASRFTRFVNRLLKPLQKAE